MIRLPLNGIWALACSQPAADTPADLPAVQARVPGGVLEALRRAGCIADPWVDPAAVSWVAGCGWRFEHECSIDRHLLDQSHVDLVLDGLGGACTVELNGTTVCTSESRHRSWRIPIGEVAQAGVNRIAITCAPGADPDPGPWRGLAIEAYRARLEGLQVSQHHDQGSVTLQVDHRPIPGGMLKLRLHDPALRLVAEVNGSRITIDEPQLWWPRGHGRQPRYLLEVECWRDGELLDQCDLRLGLRRLATTDGPKRLLVNDQTMTTVGCDWLPLSRCHGRLDDDQLRDQLLSAAAARINCLRIPADQRFATPAMLTSCDELGILVVQERPGGDDALGDNLAQRHHHPSLAAAIGAEDDALAGHDLLTATWLSQREPCPAPSQPFRPATDRRCAAILDSLADGLALRALIDRQRLAGGDCAVAAPLFAPGCRSALLADDGSWRPAMHLLRRAVAPRRVLVSQLSNTGATLLVSNQGPDRCTVSVSWSLCQADGTELATGSSTITVEAQATAPLEPLDFTADEGDLLWLHWQGPEGDQRDCHPIGGWQRVVAQPSTNHLRIERREGLNTVLLTCNRPLYWACFSCNDAAARWSDNACHLPAGEHRFVLRGQPAGLDLLHLADLQEPA